MSKIITNAIKVNGIAQHVFNENIKRNVLKRFGPDGTRKMYYLGFEKSEEQMDKMFPSQLVKITKENPCKKHISR